LKCSYRTQHDTVRRNPAAWHADGRGAPPRRALPGAWRRR